MKSLHTGRIWLPGAISVAIFVTAACSLAVGAADEPVGSTDKDQLNSAASTIKPETAENQVSKQSSSVKVTSLDSKPATSDESEVTMPKAPKIKGFHPIKRAMAEMDELDELTLNLYKQMKVMDTTIGNLQPPMVTLKETMMLVHEQMDLNHKRLTDLGGKLDSMHGQLGSVGDKLDSMHGQLGSVGDKIDSMHGQLGGVVSQVTQVESGMTGLRDDLKIIRSDLTAVRSEVNALQKPLEEVRVPLLEIAGPLQSLEKRLDRLQGLVSWILVAIGCSAVAIAIGTPIAAFLLHKHKGPYFHPVQASESSQTTSNIRQS